MSRTSRSTQESLLLRWFAGGIAVLSFAEMAAAGFPLVAPFAFSGMGHVLLTHMALRKWRISVIYGVFFLVQPLLIATERWLNVRRWRPATVRIWTLTALAATSTLFVEPVLHRTSYASAYHVLAEQADDEHGDSCLTLNKGGYPAWRSVSCSRFH